MRLQKDFFSIDTPMIGVASVALRHAECFAKTSSRKSHRENQVIAQGAMLSSRLHASSASFNAIS